MAVLDTESRRIVVRVVYDGPSGAGKTTNLTRLHASFTARRKGELISPGPNGSGPAPGSNPDGEHTLFFDWMYLDGGLVGGHPLRCQFVSVPGRPELAWRRELLLRSADAIVLVCESSPEGVREATRLHGERPSVRADGSAIPVVLQANKQDLEGCIAPEQAAHELGLTGAPLVGARAAAGVGVRETAVLAIRAAAREVQRLLLERGPEGLAGTPETWQQVHAAMLAEGCASAAIAVGRPPRTELAGVASAPKPGAASDVGGPPLPTRDAPLGTVWPAGRGRETLARLDFSAVERRHDLVGQHGVSDGSGTSDGMLYRTGDWCLKTSQRRCFESLEQAREGMLQLARRKTLLGALLPPDTVLSLAPAGDGRVWLWTVTPWSRTLRSRMIEADGGGDQAALGTALADFAAAAARSLELAVRDGLLLDVHPSNFAVVGGALAYLDDDIAAGERVPAIGHALLRRVDEYAAHPAAVASYAAAVREGLLSLSREERDRLALESALTDSIVRSEAARTLRREWIELLWRSE